MIIILLYFHLTLYIKYTLLIQYFNIYFKNNPIQNEALKMYTSCNQTVAIFNVMNIKIEELLKKIFKYKVDIVWLQTITTFRVEYYFQNKLLISY